MKTLILGTIVALSIPAMAQAQDRATYQERQENRFAGFDTNSSGILENAELVAMLEQQEERRAERTGEDARPVRARRVTRWLDGKDTDGDGQLSLVEFITERMARFDEQDVNNNGVRGESEKN